MRGIRLVAVSVLLIMGLAMSGCKSGYRSTSEVSISGEDIIYLKDQRTNLCFAVLALENPISTKIRHVTMASVPCESLGDVATQ